MPLAKSICNYVESILYLLTMFRAYFGIAEILIIIGSVLSNYECINNLWYCVLRCSMVNLGFLIINEYHLNTTTDFKENKYPVTSIYWSGLSVLVSLSTIITYYKMDGSCKKILSDNKEHSMFRVVEVEIITFCLSAIMTYFLYIASTHQQMNMNPDNFNLTTSSYDVDATTVNPAEPTNRPIIPDKLHAN